jgi:beta-glucanase (GH16 family)
VQSCAPVFIKHVAGGDADWVQQGFASGIYFPFTMKHYHYLFFLTCMLTAAAASDEWELVWSDEFDYEGLPDERYWGYDVGGHGWGNRELQYYTEARLENASVADGVLTITARKEAYEGMEYTSARLVTLGKVDFHYGRIDIRAKLPSGVGTWPALWMLSVDRRNGVPWPQCGEIDIVEHVGFDQGMIHSTTHSADRNWMNQRRIRGTVEVPTCSEAFHTYTLIWTEQEIQTFVDGEQFYSYPNEGLGEGSWPFNKPFFLILNIAVGGGWGGRQGVDPDIFPQTLEIDYVRYYQMHTATQQACKESASGCGKSLAQ